jgi:nitrogen fixation/metabolism regulation signal transduction histidine kinase
MVYKSFNLSMMVRLFLFGLASSAMGILCFQQKWLLAAPLVVIVLTLGYNFFYFVNGLHRKVAFFFEAAINDDTTVRYAENVHPKSLKVLHQSMNRLNEHLENIKLRSEYRERFFTEMLKSSATGYLVVDEKGYVEQVNDAALSFIGLPHISHLDLLKQKNPELHTQLLQIKPGQHLTLRLLHNSELRLISLKGTRLNYENNRFRLFTMNDIKAEIEESELESWQKLIRVMTHEIMNSVAPITSLSNTLSRIFIRNHKPIPVEEVTVKHIENIIDGLDVIENTGQGLMRFVEDYRKLTRMPDPVHKTIPISNWLSAIRLLMKNKLAEEQIDLTINKETRIDTLVGDERLLSQVMINVLNNAIEALHKQDNKRIIIQIAENSPGRLKIVVTDNGKGIPPEEIDKIFIPFYTTKESGSGIGLSLSRKIMRLHKGRISVFSKPGQYTSFILDF